MTHLGWRCHLLLGLLCLVPIGCAAPYAYDGGGPAPPGAVSGRFTGAVDCAHGDLVDCASCAETDCVGCGDCTASACAPFDAFTLTGRLRHMRTCGAGCGEMYWGEWTYDPPDDCDPCNNHGDWVGPRCCPPGCWSRLWCGLLGQRMEGELVACDGCDDCGNMVAGQPADDLLLTAPEAEQLVPMDAMDPTEPASPLELEQLPGGAPGPLPEQTYSRSVRRPSRYIRR